MLRLLKWLLIGLAALLGTLLAVAAIAVMVIDPNDYRDEIAAVAERQLGRELTIQGEIDWTLFPWLGLEVGRVTLADAEGFHDAPFVEAERMAASVRVWPLLRGELETRALELDRPIIRLMRDEQGEPNWADLAERLGGSSAAQGGAAAPEETPTDSSAGGDSSAEGAGALADVTIGGLRIREAAIHWTDRSAGQEMVLDPVNVSLETLRLDEPIGIHADAVVGGQERIALDGEARLTLPEGEPQLTASWRLAPFDPKGVLSALGLEPPETADPDALRRLTGSGEVVADPARVELPELTVGLDDSRLQGEAALQPEGPSVELALALDAIDADRYMPPAAPDEAGSGSGDAGGSGGSGDGTGSSEPSLGDLRAVSLDLPLEPLRDLALDGTVEVGELRIAGLRIQALEASLAGADGEVGADALEAQLYDGRFSGHALLDARGEAPAFDIASRLEEVRFGPLLEDLVDRDWLHGTGRIRFAGSGGGPHLHALIEDFEGEGRLAVEDGALLGLNIPHEIRKAVAQLRREEPPEAPSDEERTDFTELTASLTLSGGVARNDDLRLTAPLLQARGAGEADILEERVDYRVETTLDEGLAAGEAPVLHHLAGTTVPLTITGHLLDPEIGVDAKGQIETALEERQEELEGRVDEEQEALEDKADEELQEQEDRAKERLRQEMDDLL
ncbi:MAG: AsmA family protein [Halorhodospira sp.]